ncbi:MAG TPA: GIY-YIG nuclease family protein [Candidatus Saccharimonadales bacterium]|nr:GIY-YIG nuclease family protein [Candidatus Saccharimonadales bacterium]
MKRYWVYIICSQKNGTLYTGVTNNLARRIYEHQQKFVDGFTKKYNVHKLIYVEEYAMINDALFREKCIKRWNRSWKLKLIEEKNPEWNDLSQHLLFESYD